MSNFIIDLNYLCDKPYQSMASYYKKQIPCNANYKYYIIPYHSNESYYFRDIYNNRDREKLLNNSYTNRPVSNKKYNSSKCYIPSMPKGEIIKYEIYPIKCPLYNAIPYKYTIQNITVYSSNLTSTFTRELRINVSDSIIKSPQYINIPFITESVVKHKSFYIVKYIPKIDYIIDISSYYEIDIEEFVNNIDLHIISSRNNIHIRCSILK